MEWLHSILQGKNLYGYAIKSMGVEKTPQANVLFKEWLSFF
jgi:hypothetical protein